MLTFLCALIMLTAGTVPVEVSAATSKQYNDIARWILETYYDPEDYTDTCLFNIQHLYTRGEYENQDQLDDIYALTDEITASATTDEEKIKAVHDWICTNIIYPDDQSGYTGYPYDALANPFTVFKEKSAVCYGFSNLTQLMLQHLDIPCIIVGNFGSHIWNAVYLEERGWVFTDNTNDGSYTSDLGFISYKYYLMDPSEYDKRYLTWRLENWGGDICYYPITVSIDQPYHDIILDANGGECLKKIPFSEGTEKVLIPVPANEGKTFTEWQTQPDPRQYSIRRGDNWKEYAADLIYTKDATADIELIARYDTVKPDYTVPTGLTAYVGDTLADVVLPEGFTWNNPTKLLDSSGSLLALATYTPEDLNKYRIVDNIYIRVLILDRPAFKSHSVLLSGQIGVNFFMQLPEISGVNYDDSYMEFTVSGKDGETSRDSYDPQDMNSDDTLYRFTCKVNSIQMADTITAVFHYTEKGEEKTISSTYSVEEYISSYIASCENKTDINEQEQATINLVKALADYGYHAQLYLSTLRGWSLVDDHAAMRTVYRTGYSEDEKTAAINAIDAGAVVSGQPSDIEKITYSLLLDSDTSIYVYFTPKAAYTGNITVTVDGKTVSPVKQNDGRYRISVSDIAAHKLSDPHTVNITTASGTAVLTTSALSYIKEVLESTEDAKTINSMMAIYCYAKTAASYNN